jgi:hypothetical protein
MRDEWKRLKVVGCWRLAKEGLGMKITRISVKKMTTIFSVGRKNQTGKEVVFSAPSATEGSPVRDGLFHSAGRL